MLRDLEARSLPAVRPAGLVMRRTTTARSWSPIPGRSWQYRRLLMRIPRDACPSTGSGCSTPWPACWSTCTATACSGATARWPTRCSRGTARCCRPGWSTRRPARSIRRLTDGQRQHDLDILVENVAGGLMDLAQPAGPQPDDVRRSCSSEAAERGRPLPGAVGRAARRADLLLRRPATRSRARSGGCTTSGFAVDEVDWCTPAGDEHAAAQGRGRGPPLPRQPAARPDRPGRRARARPGSCSTTCARTRPSCAADRRRTCRCAAVAPAAG